MGIFRYQLLARETLKIAIGSSGVRDGGWISTEETFLNLLKEGDWERYFYESSISNIMAEHVWEHLTVEEGGTAAKICYRYLGDGGRLRIAVPDGNHPSKEYLDWVKPGGVGAGAEDHKVLYTIETLTEVLKSAGFEVEGVEYYEDGKFNRRAWSKEDGFIRRSLLYYDGFTKLQPSYTSLIVDGVKHV